MKRTLLLILLTIALLHALHITEDTVWDRRENPYIFEENVYVHSNATLTILPGCEIHIKAMPSSNGDNFWYDSSGEAEAKIFYVSGRINAIGTEEEPITFTRYPDTEAYAWGGIFVDEGADKPIFQYCEFKGTYRNVFLDWTETCGAVCCHNGDFRIENCTFTNCQTAIGSNNIQEDMFIYGNIIQATEEAQYYPDSRYFGFSISSDYEYNQNHQCVVARNQFIDILDIITGTYSSGAIQMRYIYNKYVRSNEYRIYDDAEESLLRTQSTVAHYGDRYYNWASQIRVKGNIDTVGYFRKNYVYDHDIDEYSMTLIMPGFYSYISENTFDGDIRVQTYGADSTIICNNIVMNGNNEECISVYTPNAIYNNLYINSMYVRSSDDQLAFFGNTFATDKDYCISHPTIGSNVYGNLLIAEEEIIHASNPRGTFSYNYMNHPLPVDPYFYDGGGNIIGDDPMFADTLNGDYSLADGSPCIDAGMPDGDYPPTDILGNVRVWDGDGDGIATIDIGAFEYGAPFWGGIEGYVYEEDGETPLDIAKITVDGVQFPEWSDSTGWFRILTGPGTFTLNIERMHYDDQQVSGIVVEQGSPTYQNVTMQGLEAHDYDNLIQKYTITIEQNSPNPFNPTTTISYSIPADSRVVLNVYNIKGQLVKRLVDEHIERGQHQAIWNGNDETGKRVSSGVYLYRLESCGKKITKKCLLLK